MMTAIRQQIITWCMYVSACRFSCFQINMDDTVPFAFSTSALSLSLSLPFPFPLYLPLSVHTPFPPTHTQLRFEFKQARVWSCKRIVLRWSSRLKQTHLICLVWRLMTVWAIKQFQLCCLGNYTRQQGQTPALLKAPIILLEVLTEEGLAYLSMWQLKMNV